MKIDNEVQILDKMLENVVGGGDTKKTVRKVLGVLVPVLALAVGVAVTGVLQVKGVINWFSRAVHIDGVNDGIVRQDIGGRYVISERTKVYLGTTEYNSFLRNGMTNEEYEGLILILNPHNGIGNNTRMAGRSGCTEHTKDANDDATKQDVMRRANEYLRRLKEAPGGDRIHVDYFQVD